MREAYRLARALGRSDVRRLVRFVGQPTIAAVIASGEPNGRTKRKSENSKGRSLGDSHAADLKAEGRPPPR